MPGVDRLGELRSQVDIVDVGILNLLRRRLALAQKIGELKKSAGASVMQPERERAVIEAVRGEALRLGLEPAYAEAVFRLIIEESKKVQK